MNRHESPILRAALGLAAVAMAALTLGVSVVVPVHFAPAPVDSTALAAKYGAPSAAVEADIIPSRIEVVGGARTETTAFAPARRSAPKPGQAS